MTLFGPTREGVITDFPGTSVRAERYSSREAVPLLKRASAKQAGAAGFWYVPVGDTIGIAVDKATDKLWAETDKALDVVNNDLGFSHGVLGIFSKLAGIPYPLSVALVLLILGYLAYTLSSQVKLPTH